MTTAANEDGLSALLDYLKRTRGFDFAGYKRASLMRRIDKRMQMVKINCYEDYTDYLEVHPEEFGELFNVILINVTAFFRDADTWDYVAKEIVPRMLNAKAPHEPIRIWSAGCASGEEAYSLAIVFAETLGIEAFKEQVKIYGTDVDDGALNEARQASYSAKSVEEVPVSLRDKYFEKQGQRYFFHKELRRSVIFGRHDLIQDAPISRLDLLVCRNALMYFNAETQARILERFHFALVEGGLLFLGKAEILLNNNQSFKPIDLKRRLFQKTSRGGVRERLWPPPGAERGGNGAALVNHVRIRESAFDTAPVPQIVVDGGGVLAMANAKARKFFNLSARDLGRPLQDLELSYRPIELRLPLEQACAALQPKSLRDIEWKNPAGETAYLEITIFPLAEPGGNVLGAAVTFLDVTAERKLREDLRRSNESLEAASGELQATNEELETTNEELQSTIEELQTTNEELQSTNEELETMNEELHSANEELQTINQEMRQRTEELNQVNSFLESILTSLRSAVVALDRDLLVLIWNHRAEDMWGLRQEEVRGKHFLNLDIGLPVGELRKAIRTCLNGESEHVEVDLAAINRRGRAIACSVVCTPLASVDGDGRGVILLMRDRADRPSSAGHDGPPDEKHGAESA